MIDERLSTRRYTLGDDYSVVDMALWGWCRGFQYLMGDGVWARFPHAGRLFKEINLRPAAIRVKELPARCSFKQETDEETRASLFLHGQPTR